MSSLEAIRGFVKNECLERALKKISGLAPYCKPCDKYLQALSTLQVLRAEQSLVDLTGLACLAGLCTKRFLSFAPHLSLDRSKHLSRSLSEGTLLTLS